ncbi:MAG TPA: DUF2938 domain-containing protein [Phenylobacterium sp.]|uniref:DUF2938 domain-containing protein n=1 Tax=Phenylobacterium sp. TaxID=1871053 RepID=UPI002B49D5D4|nr:DUF2938 domain-containing protein [Phenylobacterium sp.]HKR89364.1 DUF2938 domain-containing protein [Phenylobacterium sp.]HKT55049.1 DUF2938 domain-containing protein [Caulobacteraceae bacterium]
MTVLGLAGAAAAIGAGGTVVLDLWAKLLQRALNIPGPNWAMVGRWIGNMPRGQFQHASMAQAAPVRGELVIGWTAHYVIGISYGAIVVALGGSSWLNRPTPLLALAVAWVMLAAPFFVMMPGMGSGVAGSKTPHPHRTRLKSFVSHTIFGIGMFATALLMAVLR